MHCCHFFFLFCFVDSLIVWRRNFALPKLFFLDAMSFFYFVSFWIFCSRWLDWSRCLFSLCIDSMVLVQNYQIYSKGKYFLDKHQFCTILTDSIAFTISNKNYSLFFSCCISILFFFTEQTNTNLHTRQSTKDALTTVAKA